MNSGKKKILPSGWREAVEEDLDLLEKMEETVFNYACWSKKSIGSHLSFHYAWIKEDTGYILFLEADGTAEVLRIGILPKKRKQGEAEAILKALCGSFEKVILEVSNVNPPAMSLYEKLGFVEVGRRKSYYGPGEDSILMQWPKV